MTDRPILFSLPMVGVVGLLHLAYALLRTALGFMGAL